MKKNRGFTLIELLVVIGIIGILSAIVLVALSSSKSKTSSALVAYKLKSVASQAQLYTGATGGGIYVLVMNDAVSLPTPSTILSTTPDCLATPGYGTLFCDTDNGGFYPILSQLPAETKLWYGWNGNAPFDGGRWFVAASTQTGAVCIDWVTSAVKTWVGTPPTVATDFTGGTNAVPTGIFPHAYSGRGFSCN